MRKKLNTNALFLSPLTSKKDKRLPISCMLFEKFVPLHIQNLEYKSNNA